MVTKMNVFMWMKQYLKYRYLSFFLFVAVILIFPMVSYLYGNSLDGVLYGMELVSIFFFILVIWDFSQFRKKHLSLQEALDNSSEDLISFSKSYTQIEKDYDLIIKELYDKIKAITQEYQEKQDGMLNYYTLWVHQIKTPISALDLLMQKEKEEGQNVSMMEQELFKIQQYVDMVLHYLRIDSVSNDLELSWCDLDKITKNMVKKYFPLFHYNKITLNLEELETKVLSDEKWLSLMVEQILSNALKYTRGENAKIHIYVESGRRSLVIEDTGIGIRKEDIHRIFERGFTGYNGRLKEKSTGLGLFLSKIAGDKLGHQLLVESEIGKGTKVRILFSAPEWKHFVI